MKEYQKRYRQLKVRKEISFSRKEYQRFSVESDRTGLSFNAWVRSTLDAYLDQTFIVVSPEELQQLIISIRRIGNNINQIVKYAHAQSEVSPEDLVRLITMIKEVEATVEASLHHPELLEQAVRAAVVNGRLTAAHLSDLLTS